MTKMEELQNQMEQVREEAREVYRIGHSGNDVAHFHWVPVDLTTRKYFKEYKGSADYRHMKIDYNASEGYLANDTVGYLNFLTSKVSNLYYRMNQQKMRDCQLGKK